MQNKKTEFSLQRIYCGDIVQGKEPASEEEFKFSQHSQREFLFVIRGKNRYMLNRTVCELKPGDAVMIDSFLPHSSNYTMLDHDLEHLWVWFSENILFHCSIIKVYSEGHFEMTRSLSLPKELEHMIQYRWDLLRTFQTPSPELLDQLMRGPFQLLLDELKLQLEYNFPGRKKELLSEFLKNYIRNCCGRDCSLKKLSAITGYSESHLSHTFQEEAGCSVGTYLTSVRMEYTKAGLKKGKKQKEIAAELGFSSPASFWNWFRKNTEKKKTSPTE